MEKNEEPSEFLWEDIFAVTPQKNLSDEVEKLYAYYRKKGYPNYDFKNYDPRSELSKLESYDETSLLVEGDSLKQTMHSLGFLWCYFPHWVDIKCSGSQYSLSELWGDDRKLRTLIEKTYKWQLKHGNGRFTTNRLRQNAKVYLSSQSVSNFRPTAAKYLYNRYGNKGVVWDMCGGWGGRLFGFLASDCEKYIGTEPSVKTYGGLCDLNDTFRGVEKEVDLRNECAEDFCPQPNSIDLCFTSPPYFDCEQYADEETQSYKKHPTKDLWVNGFLKKMLENCSVGLKSGGYLILNIANTPKHSWIEESVESVCEELGFRLESMNYLILSSIAGKGVKKEPIYIYVLDKA